MDGYQPYDFNSSLLPVPQTLSFLISFTIVNILERTSLVKYFLSGNEIAGIV